MLLITWAMKNPVLEHWGIIESNFRESISIPIQQIARVVVHKGEITNEQMELLNRVIDVEKIPELYKEYISDPVKFSVDGDYIKENKKEYLKAWIEIGIKNPKQYLHAWIEQTKGYWNEGYDYAIWASGVTPNELGIETSRLIKPFDYLFKKYAALIMRFEILAPLRSIGLHVWLLIVLFVFNLLRGMKEKALPVVPVLMVIGTLLVATPVFSEFRYAYAVFTVLPMYVAISFLGKSQKN